MKKAKERNKKQLRLVNEKFEERGWKVCNPVYAQVSNQIFNQVYDQILDRVRGQVAGRVRWLVWHHILGHFD